MVVERERVRFQSPRSHAFNETLLVYRSHVTQVPSPSKLLGRVCSKCKGLGRPWEGRRGHWNVVASASGGSL